MGLWLPQVAAALAVVAVGLAAAEAQIATGNVYGIARDASGAVLAGAHVTLSSHYGTRTTVTSSDGAFRFLGLERGEYTVAVALSGFASTARRIRVTTGENVEIVFPMSLSGVAETVEVQAETPLVDSRRRGTATTMTNEELAQVPNPRDPWGVLKAVPGVSLDRVNIAGNENGQQLTSSSKGQPPNENTWNLDGVAITDMAATGASTAYFDFGAFEEITVTTGGSDMTITTAGTGIHLTTKRGTNAFHGSARYLVADQALSRGSIADQRQAPYTPNDLASDPRLRNADGSYRDQGDRIDNIQEYGFDFGGPVLEDRLWFYAAYGKQDIELLRLDDTPDDTLLPTWNAKLNWQATPQTMVSAFYFLSRKQRFGRTAGTGLREADSFLADQDNAETPGGLPGGLWKLQLDHTPSPNLFLSLKALYFDNGFGLVARGDKAQAGTRDFTTGTAIGTHVTYLTTRPQRTLAADGSWYVQGLGGSHELKFGFSYRDIHARSSTAWHGNQLYGYINSGANVVARVMRSYELNYAGKYLNAYLGDLFTKDRFTFNAGVRLDWQRATNLESTALANASFPELLPDAVFPGSDGYLQEWTNLTPRLGLSYALDPARRTILRASYARYYQQLPMGNVVIENPTTASYLAYAWRDANGDRFAQPEEVDLASLRYWAGVDPANPGSVSPDTVSKIDRDRRPRSDDEWIVGLDRELGPSFAAGLALTYRRQHDWTNATYRFKGACADPLAPTADSCPLMGAEDYTRNAPVTANGYTAFSWSPVPALVAAGRGGSLLTNRKGYSTSYKGVELTLNKRLSSRWMARAAFNYGDWTQSVEHPVSFTGNPTPRQGDNLVSGDPVATLAGTFFVGGQKWQIYANGLYQLPWGFDVSAALWARQGGLKPIFLNLPAGNDGTIPVPASASIEDERYEDVWDLDLRLAKTFRVGKQGYVTLAGEWFNVANAGTVLLRVRQANSAAYNRVDQLLQPSILRLGATLGF